MIRRLLAAWIALIAVIWLGVGHAQFNGCTTGFCSTRAPSGGGNTVTLDNCTSVQPLASPTQTSPWTLNSNSDVPNISTGLTDPVLVAWIGFINNNNTPSAVGVTWNGVSMTSIITVANPATAFAGLFGLRNPATGIHNLVVSWTGGAQQPNEFSCSFSQVSSASDGAAFTNTNTATGTSTTSSVTITNNANDMVVAVHDGFQCTSISSTSGTNVFIQNAGNSWCAAGNRTAGTGSGIAMTATDNSGAWGAAGFSLAHD